MQSTPIAWLRVNSDQMELGICYSRKLNNWLSYNWSIPAVAYVMYILLVHTRVASTAIITLMVLESITWQAGKHCKICSKKKNVDVGILCLFVCNYDLWKLKSHGYVASHSRSIHKSMIFSSDHFSTMVDWYLHSFITVKIHFLFPNADPEMSAHNN